LLKVVLVGQTPPPYGGYTVMTAYTLEGRFEGVQLVHVPVQFSREMHEMGQFSLRKLGHLAVVVGRVALARLRTGPAVLYYTPGGPRRVPLYRDLFILLTTRWMFGRTIFHFHAGGVSDLYPRLNPVLRALFRRAYFGADVAIRTSVLAPEDPRLLRAKREVVIPNGIPDHAQALGEQRERDEAAAPKILFMGVLSESKGVLVLLDACARLVSHGLRFAVDLVGDFESGHLEERVRQFIHDHGLVDVVALRGVLTGSEKHLALSSADVFCLPTWFHSETFGVVLLEAMQFRLPVVSTRWRGIPSIVVDGVNGYLVDVQDAVALSRALEALIGDRQLARQMGERGRQMYEERFTLARFHSNLQKVFDALRAEHDASVPSPVDP
jgi:glycosyltransferase involved in cell wall biosynthesis